MKEARLLKSTEWARWDDFAGQCSGSTLAHSSNWFRVLHGAYGVAARYLIVEDHAGRIVAGLPLVELAHRILPNRLSSLPCAQTCSPLAVSLDAHEALLRKVEELRRRRRTLALEMKVDSSYYFPFNEATHLDTSYCTFELDLADSLEHLQSRMHTSCIRRPLRKALRGGLELVIGDSPADIRRFYDLYLRMRRRKGLLPQPLSFFEHLWRFLHADGKLEVLHARAEGRLISSLVLLWHPDTVTYEYGASVPAYLHLHPSHFLLWHAIRRAKERGRQRFDFGRCHESALGLIEFKRRWGGTRKELRYFYFSEKKVYQTGRQSPALRKMMAIFTKTMSPRICRLASRLMYRHLI